jgi:hypothetical protein
MNREEIVLTIQQMENYRKKILKKAKEIQQKIYKLKKILEKE